MMATTLCFLCSNIQFHRLPQYPPSFQRVGYLYLGQGLCFLDIQQYGLERPEIFGLQHHKDLVVLANSAQSCIVCSLVHEQVQQFLHKVHLEERVGNNGAIYKDLKPKRYRFQITRRKSQEGFILWTDDGPNQRVWYVAVFGFAVHEETDPLSHVFKGRPIVSDPSAPRTLDRAFDWVSKCNYHENCTPKPSDTRFPTRLLDVGTREADQIKLCETKGDSGFYTTLSYVWGKTPQLTTTKERYEAHREGIPAERFPKTMQDAFIVTRKMDVRFIWIDALCIIQDDQQDWQREAAQMGSVYANSFLTISAAGAGDNTEGCFLPRQPPAYTTFNYKCEQKIGQLSIYPVTIEGETSQTEVLLMRGEPITDRGWCFQERVLSRRSLLYAKDQMFFECKEHFLAEDGLSMDGRILSIYQPYNAISSFGQANTMRDLWDELVEVYSCRKLTKISDKLPALSGLAEKFAKIFGDVYIAGLWQSTLFTDLLWSGDYNAPWPPAEYHAPSWSWAAVTGSQRPEKRYRQPFGTSQFQPVAGIISAGTKITGINPYGEVSDGRIVIQAPLVPVHVTRDVAGDPDRVREANGYFTFTTPFETSLHYACLDYTIRFEMLETIQIFALVMGRDAALACYPSLLILLDSVGIGGSPNYRRIGFIKLQENILGNGIPRWGVVYPIINLV